jgi:hypothetical protein
MSDHHGWLFLSGPLSESGHGVKVAIAKLGLLPQNAQGLLVLSFFSLNFSGVSVFAIQASKTTA